MWAVEGNLRAGTPGGEKEQSVGLQWTRWGLVDKDSIELSLYVYWGEVVVAEQLV